MKKRAERSDTGNGDRKKNGEKEANVPLFCGDIEKAFDNVNWVNMFKVLKNIGVVFWDRQTIWRQYKNQTELINF